MSTGGKVTRLEMTSGGTSPASAMIPFAGAANAAARQAMATPCEKPAKTSVASPEDPFQIDASTLRTYSMLSAMAMSRSSPVIQLATMSRPPLLPV